MPINFCKTWPNLSSLYVHKSRIIVNVSMPISAITVSQILSRVWSCFLIAGVRHRSRSKISYYAIFNVSADICDGPQF